MFTGLIEDVGQVVRAERRAGSLRLSIKTHIPLQDVKVGDSIAVDGACYTAVALHQDTFEVDVGPESLERTLAGAYVSGTRVNLERALQVGARLGGHFVLGHVDALGTVKERHQRGDAWDFTIAAPADVLDVTPPKGSITVSGISLTVNAVDKDAFHISIIPHTWEHTSLREAVAGSRVHLESDVLARSVQWMLQRSGVLPGGQSGVTLDLLKRSGFMAG